MFIFVHHVQNIHLFENTESKILQLQFHWSHAPDLRFFLFFFYLACQMLIYVHNSPSLIYPESTCYSYVEMECCSCMQLPCSSTWGQWNIIHSHFKGLIFHPVSLSPYIKYKHNQSCAVPPSLWLAWPHWPAAHRCVCGFGSSSLNLIEPPWNAFHKCKHFSNLGQNINKWCWEL